MRESAVWSETGDDAGGGWILALAHRMQSGHMLPPPRMMVKFHGEAMGENLGSGGAKFCAEGFFLDLLR